SVLMTARSPEVKSPRPAVSREREPGTTPVVLVLLASPAFEVVLALVVPLGGISAKADVAEGAGHHGLPRSTDRSSERHADRRCGRKLSWLINRSQIAVTRKGCVPPE